MREDDLIYFRRRAAEERSAVERASTLAAARAHKALAERYAALADSHEKLARSHPLKANDA